MILFFPESRRPGRQAPAGYRDHIAKNLLAIKATESLLDIHMKLFLVRHGIAVDRGSGEIKSDAERPLTPEGCQEATLVARGLKQAGCKLDLLVTSPLVRARQTAVIFADVFKLAQPELVCLALAPGGQASDLFQFLKNTKTEAIALIGHEPDMSMLAQTLLQAEFDMAFKKAAVLRIDISEMPPIAPGVLKWFLPPKIARLLAR